MPNSRASLRVLFWREFLPGSIVLVVVTYTQGLLEYYPCASPVSKLYIWTCIWLFASLISLRYLIGMGPVSVAAVGWTHSYLMLSDIYSSIGDPCKSGMDGVTLTDVVYAGVFVALAIVGSSYLTTTRGNHSLREQERERESGEDSVVEEKA
ncbi:hypothetical protein KC360_g8836 [Hortaea werneckii]|nr:hypothetical protein KC361_g8839 [Hortaea werneckii]KAI6877810.1 hypothetical protein KC325_g9016 [Hortaea werneckii]KAI6986552.1 hypothetical protein KC359_g8692 [Hortaea werneckii]KAI7139977.1 hypothetical protein KC344_g9027 [Hortaea werneckii]KAI7167106.1 hypothetical protein KC360_g8836 [Hortaea werneckii]